MPSLMTQIQCSLTCLRTLIILRDIEKPTESEQAEQVRRSVWRRESDIRNELDRTKEELNHATDRVLEVEQKCNNFESRAQAAESRYKNALRSLKELEELKSASSTEMSDTSMANLSLNGQHPPDEREREKLVNHILDGRK